MKIQRAIDGQYSEIKLEDGKKIFLSVLPDRITVSTMVMFIPTKKIWEFIFPFYIRTSNEAWDSSKDILQITLDSLSHVTNLDELKDTLENQASGLLREYVNNHGEQARDISVDKVGIHAIKQMLNPKGLSKIENIYQEYGKVLETVMQDTLTKYPAFVFPKSLLPYPKNKITEALREASKYTNDPEMVKILESGLVYLDSFIEDKEANEKNQKLLNNEEFMKALKSRK